MDPASKKLLQFGLIGLVIAGALVVGFEVRPSGIFPSNGTLVIEITDAPPVVPAAGIPCGDCAVTSLNVTVDSIKVHRSGAFNLTSEWIEVLNTTKTISILKVRNVMEILGSTSVPEGMITSIRMHVTNAIAVIPGRSGTSDLMVPSDELKVNLQSFAAVKGGETTTIVLDFSLHVVCQGNEKCKLTPVLTVAEVRGPE